MRFSFAFLIAWWPNLRRAIRALPAESIWYRFLLRINLAFERRAVKASWIYKQQNLETSDSYGLDLWGQRMQLARAEGENDTDYKARLLIHRAVQSSGASISVKMMIAQSLTGAAVQIFKIYRSSLHLDAMFRVGGPYEAIQFSRKYILYRYRVLMAALDESFNRIGLNRALQKINIGGNWPEFRENLGPFTPMGIGRPYTLPLQSRRSEQTILELVY
ncbi:MAG: hypothetical protein HS115_11805 [Spirochaetales bacterium]|nr:hypothetical protein [Spirochaetales bacterium]